MLLLILVKSGLGERFTNIQATYVGAGIMGLMVSASGHHLVSDHSR